MCKPVQWEKRAFPIKVILPGVNNKNIKELASTRCNWDKVRKD